MTQTTRRGFCAALAAAFAAPMLAPYVRITKDIPWHLFTDLEIIRYDLSSPWVAHGMKVASNGRMLVSVPSTESGGSSEARVPNIGVLPWKAFDSSGWRPASELQTGRPFDAPSLCPTCGGTSRIGSTHQVEEEFTVRDGPNSYKDFGGVFKGGSKCGDCSDGLADAPSVVAGDSEYDPGYVARLHMLGDFDWRVDNQILLTRFGDGGKGLLMNRVRTRA